MPLTDEWINKIEIQYSKILFGSKKESSTDNKLQHRYKRENVTLSERSQSPKPTYCVIPFI